MSDAKNHEYLIARYLNGQLSLEDEKDLLRWIREQPKNEKLFLSVKDVWDASKKVDDRELLLQFYKRLAARKSGVFFRPWMKGVAAAALLLIMVLAGLLFRNDFSVPGQIESFSVPKGSRSQVVLTDGTKVFLNSDSRLTIGRQFSSPARTVILSGEAYFEVATDPKHPFTIQTGQFDVTVTGTRLNVCHYPEDEMVSTTLVEGKASLTTKDNDTFGLKPGEKISFDVLTMNPVVAPTETGSEIAWVRNEFLFRQIPFPELIRRLERWYDVTLLYREEAFNSILYTGSFKNQETISQVLDALKLTSPIDYKRTDFREFELIYKPM